MTDIGSQRYFHTATGDHPEQKRLAMARDVATSGIAPIAQSCAEFTLSLLPNVSIATALHAAAHDQMTRELLKENSDVIAVSIPHSGEASAAQYGHHLIGGGVSVQAGTDSSAGTLQAGRFITLALSRPALAELAPDFAAALGKPIPTEDPALRLLVRYLDAVLAADELSDPNVARSVSAHILDLAALVLGARGDNAALSPGGAKAARLKALKADVMTMLGNNDLSSEMLASRHGISSRYVRKLFEQGGSSFTVFVLNERLARVRRMLPEERYAHLTIAQIAHACGFNDISYFNRAFRRQFGGTPTDVREACARQN